MADVTQKISNDCPCSPLDHYAPAIGRKNLASHFVVWRQDNFSFGHILKVCGGNDVEVGTCYIFKIIDVHNYRVCFHLTCKIHFRCDFVTEPSPLQISTSNFFDFDLVSHHQLIQHRLWLLFSKVEAWLVIQGWQRGLAEEIFKNNWMQFVRSETEINFTSVALKLKIIKKSACVTILSDNWLIEKTIPTTLDLMKIEE